jgi:hypothetical protein
MEKTGRKYKFMLSPDHYYKLEAMLKNTLWWRKSFKSATRKCRKEYKN